MWLFNIYNHAFMFLSFILLLWYILVINKYNLLCSQFKKKQLTVSASSSSRIESLTTYGFADLEGKEKKYFFRTELDNHIN